MAIWTQPRAFLGPCYALVSRPVPQCTLKRALKREFLYKIRENHGFNVKHRVFYTTAIIYTGRDRRERRNPSFRLSQPRARGKKLVLWVVTPEGRTVVSRVETVRTCLCMENAARGQFTSAPKRELVLRSLFVTHIPRQAP